MPTKLTWDEIKKHYDREWVELVDYDWPDEEPDPKSGIVRVHAKTREEFDRLAAVNPPHDSACVFVGEPLATARIRSYSSIVITPLDA